MDSEQDSCASAYRGKCGLVVQKICPWGVEPLRNGNNLSEGAVATVKVCLGPHMWCEHQQVCLACDDNIRRCMECLFVRGDGESTLHLADSYKLYLDFDGTLSSTKKGESPLGRVDATKRHQKHTVDSYLRELCCQQYVNVSGRPVQIHIVTRNKHKEYILEFIEAEGCCKRASSYVAGRRVGTSKVDIIRSIIGECDSNIDARKVYIEGVKQNYAFHSFLRTILIRAPSISWGHCPRRLIRAPAVENPFRQPCQFHLKMFFCSDCLIVYLSNWITTDSCGITCLLVVL